MKRIVLAMLLALVVVFSSACGIFDKTIDNTSGDGTSANVVDEVVEDVEDTLEKDETVESVDETTNVEPVSDEVVYSKLIGTWISATDKFTLSMDGDSTLFLDYDSFLFVIDEYISIADIVDDKYTIYYNDIMGCDMIIDMEFYPDAIVMNHRPVVENDGDTYTNIFEKYVHSDATLDIKEYFGEDNYYQEFSSSDDSIVLVYEMENLSIKLSLDNGNHIIYYDRRMGTAFEKGVKLVPDEKNGKSITFKIQKNSDNSYTNSPLGTDGTVTFTFDSGFISYKLTDCSFETNSKEGILSKEDSTSTSSQVLDTSYMNGNYVDSGYETYPSYSVKADSYYADTYPTYSVKADSYYTDTYGDYSYYSYTPN